MNAAEAEARRLDEAQRRADRHAGANYDRAGVVIIAWHRDHGPLHSHRVTARGLGRPVFRAVKVAP